MLKRYAVATPIIVALAGAFGVAPAAQAQDTKVVVKKKSGSAMGVTKKKKVVIKHRDSGGTVKKKVIVKHRT